MWSFVIPSPNTQGGKGLAPRAFPALVGNNRMHGRCGCKLVITSQEIALLLLPESEDEGSPARWRRSSNILTPSHLAGVRGEEQPALF